MTSPRQATAESLVYEPNYYLESFPSCCSVDTPVRLTAQYIEDSRIKALVEDAAECGTDPEQYTRRELSRHGLAELLEGGLCEIDQALPVDIAFAALLARLRNTVRRSRNRMFIMTDNMGRNGDVHNGPFSTKNFCKWLEDNDLANITSHRVGNMQSWSFDFVSKLRAANAEISRAITKLLKIQKQRQKWADSVEKPERTRRRNGRDSDDFYSRMYRDEDFF